MTQMNMCPVCGDSNLHESAEASSLAIMKLPHVIANGIHVDTCEGCGERFKDYPITHAFDVLIVKALLMTKRDLYGKEMAFIRKILGYTAKKWASEISVNPVTLSNWETEKEKINKTAEMALRLKAALEFEVDSKQIASIEGEPVVEVSALPVTAPMLYIPKWSNANKRVVNGR